MIKISIPIPLIIIWLEVNVFGKTILPECLWLFILWLYLMQLLLGRKVLCMRLI